MSFLDKLFSKHAPRGASGGVRQHLTREIERLERNELNYKDSFTLCVFGPLESFGSRDGHPTQELSAYTLDAALFELACYTHTCCDVWLFAHAEHARFHLMPLLSSRLASVFESALGFTGATLGDLVNERMAVYGKLFAERSDVRNIHSRLSVTMHNTVKRGSPYKGAPNDIPLVSALLDFALKTELIEWDTRFLPHTNDALQQAADALRTNAA